MDSNPPAQAILTGYSSRISRVAFSPDGQMLASGALWDATTWIWDMTNDSPTLHSILTTVRMGGVRSIAFSPDGHLLVSGLDDGKIRVWDITKDSSTLHVALTWHEDEVSSIAFSSDGQLLALGSDDGMVRVWGKVHFRLKWGVVQEEYQ